MKKVVVAVVMFATAVAVSGCIIAPPGYYGRPRPGYCYYHPYRC
ncbi:MAG: hypothetical protein RQ966_11035 [Acetobacteraceae bacterium]|nr:hypothetical protein [Acetobacteraceae bacterium]